MKREERERIANYCNYSQGNCAGGWLSFIPYKNADKPACLPVIRTEIRWRRKWEGKGGSVCCYVVMMIHLNEYQRLRWRFNKGIFSRVIGAAELCEVPSSILAALSRKFKISLTLLPAAYCF